MPVVLATCVLEAKIRSMVVQSQPRQKAGCGGTHLSSQGIQEAEMRQITIPGQLGLCVYVCVCV
jgi:hypothetical protein